MFGLLHFGLIDILNVYKSKEGPLYECLFIDGTVAWTEANGDEIYIEKAGDIYAY